MKLPEIWKSSAIARLNGTEEVKDTSSPLLAVVIKYIIFDPAATCPEIEYFLPVDESNR